MRLRPFAPGLAKLFTQRRIRHELINACGKIALKFFRIPGSNGSRSFARANQNPGFTIDYDFFNSTDGAGHNRRLARHRFQIDDAKRS